MTDTETLEAVIQKAIDNGWKPEGADNYKMVCGCGLNLIYDYYDVKNGKYCTDCGKKYKEEVRVADYYEDGGKVIFLWRYRDGEDSRVRDYKHIIYSHDFAKALWGEGDLKKFNDGKTHITRDYIPKWQYHLQQMVISDDPIKYLRENSL